jgi:uncharacterized membrane protein YoaK (UPF0700 family)/uncharacterized membrane protein YphA (DoxX/SURF4 family)
VTPGPVAALLRAPSFGVLARILLTLPFWGSGVEKLTDLHGAVAEAAALNLQPAGLVVAATIAVQLVGSALVILNRWTWLGAGALGVFTAFATLIAHPFWTVSDQVERFHARNTFLEHIAPDDRGLHAGGDPGRADGAQPMSGRWLLPVLLAFTAGYVDTLGFVGLFGLFTAHVTGNFVLIGAMAARPTGGLTAKLLALPVFVLGVALATVAATRWRARGQDCGLRLLAVEAVLLAAFMLAALAAGPLLGTDHPAGLAAAELGVLAMSIQNAAGRLAFSELSPTTVMTGNVTQVVIDAVALLWGREHVAEARTRLARFLPPVVAFAVGALGGGFGFAAAGFWALLLPISLVLALIPLQTRAHALA